MVEAGVLPGTKGLGILGAVGSTVRGRMSLYSTVYGTVYRALDSRLGSRGAVRSWSTGGAVYGAVHGSRRGVSAGQLATGGIFTVYGTVHCAVHGGW